MKIYNDLSEVQSLKTAVALGFFDGMHLGHKKVILKTISCKNQGLSPAVFTFTENPKSILTHTKDLKLMSNSEKIEYLENLGVESLYLINFLDIYKLTPEEFVKKILFEKLNAGAVICGFNYHFGYGGTAGSEDLKKICKKYNIKTYIVKPVLYKKEAISSTRIRKAIKSNDIKSAKRMLKNDNLKSSL